MVAIENWILCVSYVQKEKLMFNVLHEGKRQIQERDKRNRRMHYNQTAGAGTSSLIKNDYSIGIYLQSSQYVGINIFEYTYRNDGLSAKVFSAL